MKKIVGIALLISMFTVNAQTREDKGSFINFVGGIMGVNVNSGYVVLQRPKPPSNLLLRKQIENWWLTQLRIFQPICFDENNWIFSYQMLGEDDSFYNSQSKAQNLNQIRLSQDVTTNYNMRIEVEEDNLDFRDQSYYSNVCLENNAEIFRGIQYKHGIITYIGDTNINPPF